MTRIESILDSSSINVEFLETFNASLSLTEINRITLDVKNSALNKKSCNLVLASVRVRELWGNCFCNIFEYQ